MSDNTVKKVFKLFLTSKPRPLNERNSVRGLRYVVYYSSEDNSFDFNKFETTVKEHSFFTTVDKDYPFYYNYNKHQANITLRITDSKPGNYVVENLTNELPFTITKIATDLKQRAYIEVEMGEKVANAFDFNLKQTILTIDILEPNQAIESKVKTLMGFSFV